VGYINFASEMAKMWQELIQASCWLLPNSILVLLLLGQWSIEEPKEVAVTGDLGLVLKVVFNAEWTFVACI